MTPSSVGTASRSEAEQDRGAAELPPGGDAEKPSEMPARGWLQVAKRGWREAKTDQVPLLAAGVAFYGFLAIFPTLVAIILLYGLIADPSTLAEQIGQLTANLPPQAGQLISTQVQTLASQRQQLGVGLIISVVVALWSASGGVNNLMTAITVAYDEDPKRGFIKKRALALLLTLGVIVFMAVVIALVVGAPAAFAAISPALWVRVVAGVVRWVVLVIVVSLALAILYRVAPDRDAPKMRWVSVGAAVATVLWLLASVGFTLYVSSFGNYAKTYGALAGIVILLLWLWITAYAVLLGAEINAETEQQTKADTTRGAPQPLGERDAVKADTLPDEETGASRDN